MTTSTGEGAHRDKLVVEDVDVGELCLPVPTWTACISGSRGSSANCQWERSRNRRGVEAGWVGRGHLTWFWRLVDLERNSSLPQLLSACEGGVKKMLWRLHGRYFLVACVGLIRKKLIVSLVVHQIPNYLTKEGKNGMIDTKIWCRTWVPAHLI
jgi:hypothetical protein